MNTNFEEWDILEELSKPKNPSFKITVPCVLLSCTIKEGKVIRGKAKFNKEAIELLNLKKDDTISFLINEKSKETIILNSTSFKNVAEDRKVKLTKNFTSYVSTLEYEAIYSANNINISESYYYKLEPIQTKSVTVYGFKPLQELKVKEKVKRERTEKQKENDIKLGQRMKKIK